MQAGSKDYRTCNHHTLHYAAHVHMYSWPEMIIDCDCLSGWSKHGEGLGNGVESYDINELLPTSEQVQQLIPYLDDVKSFAHLILYVTSSEIMFGVKCCTTVRVLSEHIPPYGWDSWPGTGLALFGHSLQHLGLPHILLHVLHSHTHHTHRHGAHPS